MIHTNFIFIRYSGRLNQFELVQSGDGAPSSPAIALTPFHKAFRRVSFEPSNRYAQRLERFIQFHFAERAQVCGQQFSQPRGQNGLIIVACDATYLTVKAGLTFQGALPFFQTSFK
jgi:hypothetical protein